MEAEWHRRQAKKAPSKDHSPSGVEEYQPASDWQKRQEELSRDGKQQGEHDQSRNSSLDHRTRRGDDGQAKDAEHDQHQILAIPEGPSMRSQRSNGIRRREGRFERGDGRGRRLSASQLRPQFPAQTVRDEDGYRGPRERYPSLVEGSHGRVVAAEGVVMRLGHRSHRSGVERVVLGDGPLSMIRTQAFQRRGVDGAW